MNELIQAWHALSAEQTLKVLDVDPQRGLSSAEVERRIKRFGPNTIIHQKIESRLKTFFRQLKNPLVFILVASTALTATMGKPVDSMVILCVVVVNTLIGYAQERQAGEAIQSLVKMLPENATVRRDGNEILVPASNLTLGDIIIVQPGDKVTSDIRLIEIKELTVDEAALTGESVPIAKQIEPSPEDSSLGERSSMLFEGSLVTAGQGFGVVVAIGKNTEFGKISDLLEEATIQQTPLSIAFKSITKWITVVTLILSSLLFFVGISRDFPWIEASLSAVTLAVAFVPEGLPAVVTITSAIGMRRMAKQRAIVRQLQAVETLGSADVICVDKTGTLTKNQITVQQIWIPSQRCDISGVGLEPRGEFKCDEGVAPDDSINEIMRVSLLCSDASLERSQENDQWEGIGDPTEVALVVAARKLGMHEDDIRKESPRQDVLPFDSKQMFMATLNSVLGEKVLFVKGAPEVILNKCKQDESADKGKKQAQAMTTLGMRVIAFAKAKRDALGSDIFEPEIEFLGLVGMRDPAREGVREAISTCHGAGVGVKMITGDHPETAKAIAKELNILKNDGVVFTGKEARKASSEEIESVDVFARVEPSDKVKIVQALQSRGHVVGMTGDGVNDAAALKNANIGIAMGVIGTAVAKEASDMILADDNFTTIEIAIEEGRRVFDNILKSVIFILPTSLAQSLVIAASVLFFPVELRPMSPVQVLWVNLIVAIGLALPLGFEVKEPDIMKRKPRETTKPVFSGFIIFRIFFVSLFIAGASMALFLWEYRSEILLGQSREVALAEGQTMAVTTIVLSQVFYLLNCRSLTSSIREIGFFSNRYVFIGVGIVLFAQFAYVHLPFMHYAFQSKPLSFQAWSIVLLIAFLIFPIIEIEKKIWKRKQGS